MRESRELVRQITGIGFRRRLTASVLTLLVIAVVWNLSSLSHDSVDLAGSTGGRNDVSPDLLVTQVRVIRAIDGDTLLVDVPDGFMATEFTRVRLWGVDCPEIGRNGAASQPFAVESMNLAQDLAANVRVTLVIEPHRVRDDYDRLLAHVELPDGSGLAERLLAAGMARNETRWRHGRMADFVRIEDQARKSRVGLWRSE